jgi:hypothetical protein
MRWWCWPPALPRPPGCLRCFPMRPWPADTCPRFLRFLCSCDGSAHQTLQRRLHETISDACLPNLWVWDSRRRPIAPHRASIGPQITWKHAAAAHAWRTANVRTTCPAPRTVPHPNNRPATGRTPNRNPAAANLSGAARDGSLRFRSGPGGRLGLCEDIRRSHHPPPRSHSGPSLEPQPFWVGTRRPAAGARADPARARLLNRREQPFLSRLHLRRPPRALQAPPETRMAAGFGSPLRLLPTTARGVGRVSM